MSRSRFGWAVSLAAITLSVAGVVPTPAPGQISELPAFQGTPLFLEVVLNGAPTGLIAAFTERTDGSLAIEATELAELGIATDAGAAAPDGLYDLDSMAGLTYRFDRVQQLVAIDTTADRLNARVVDAGASDVAIPAPQTDIGAALNYSLYATLADHAFAASAALDARIFSPAGLFTQSGIVGYLADERFDILRLDTTFTRSNPETLRTFRAGDFISGGLSWTRPVRLGGLQLARNFALRPDLLTMPMPDFEGTAAVPSTIDIYANGSTIYSGAVPAGPFTIANVPILSNAGTARMVVTESTGRTVETNYPFFTSPLLLRQGLLDYSIEAGFPRRSFGSASFDYGPGSAASGSVRYGLSNWLTLEGHAEAASGVVNAGVGAVAPLGGYGLAAAAVAGSTGRDGSGLLLSGDITLRLGPAQVRLATRHTIGQYADIASVTATSGNWQPVPALDQVSLGLPVGTSGSDATLSYTRADLSDGSERSILGISWGRKLPGNSSLSLYGYQSFGDEPGTGLLLGLSRPLGPDVSISGSGRLGSANPGGSLEITRSERAAGGWGWRLGAGATGGDDTAVDWLASASYRASAARFAAGIRSFDGDTSGSAEVSGAVVAAGGGLFLTRRFSDAFAVVDVGAPGVKVMADNHEVGQTDARGKLLVPDLRPWQVNALSIDTENLPLDMEASDTRRVVVPADRSGVVVDFGVRDIATAAIVIFRDASGAFVQAGTAGKTASGEDFVVGYDGEAYLRGLADRNQATLMLADGPCTAEFSYTPADAGSQAVVDGVTCT